MSKIEQNTTDLQAILDAVNALPEAGSGSGGGSVETCTVTINDVNYTGLSYYCVCLINGAVTTTTLWGYSITISNVVVGSMFLIPACSEHSRDQITFDNATEIGSYLYFVNTGWTALQINGDCNIQVNVSGGGGGSGA